MMYTYIMRRTQIYLTTREVAALRRHSRASGRSHSQLIREAVDRAYIKGHDPLALEPLLLASAGAWRGRRLDGALYVEGLRRGRLAGIHR